MNEDIQYFLELEKKHNLFNDKIGDMYYWEYIRFGCYQLILSKLSVMGKNEKPKNNLKKEFKNLIKLFFRDIRFCNTEKEILVLSHYRKNKNINENYYCIYTDTFINELPYSSVNLEIVTENTIDLLPTVGTRYYDVITFFNYAIQKRLLKKRYIKKVEIVSIKLKHIINETYNISVSLSELNKMIIDSLFYRKTHIKKYRNMLKKINPKIILEVVSYNNYCMVMNEVAKQMKIPIMEIQHGMIGNQHIAYNCYNSYLRFFPDYFFAFSNLWLSKNFPLDATKIKCVGFPYLEFQCKNSLKGELIFDNDEKTILVISQWTRSQFYIDFVDELAKDKNCHYNIILKIHPEDKLDLRYEKLKNRKNIKLISNEFNIYDCFRNADIQVGSYSTGLFEGLSFGLNTFVINDKKDEFIQKLINKHILNEINDVHDFLNSINVENNKFNMEEIWAMNSKQKIIEEISDIMRKYYG